MARQHGQSGVKGSGPQGSSPASRPDRPVLHLSGAKLRAALEALVRASEAVGGVERFAQAVALRADVLRDRLADGKAATKPEADFSEILPLMATVRRRLPPIMTELGWPAVRRAIVELLDGADVPGTADERLAKFCRALAASAPLPLVGRGRGWGDSAAVGVGTPPLPNPPPQRGREQGRFLRDLAAELLHGVYPEHYPLMTRWVWDARTNTGVLREIWHDPVSGDNVDHIVIDVPDTHETFLVLREELSQFLSDNGIFRQMLSYVDLLQAQVYGDYINAQGGAYLKTDFSGAADPLEHTRRILGLDARAMRGARVSGDWSVVSGAIGKDG